MTNNKQPCRAIAFFDVDETLIHCKSMFSFLEFCLVETLGEAAGGSVHADYLQQLKLARQSMTREDVNRRFYRFFDGWKLSALHEIGELWFKETNSDKFFIREISQRFLVHKENGDETILLSGSADFILAPIKRHLEADNILAITLVKTGNDLTNGEINGVQTIGAGKAQALRMYLCSHSNPPTYIYGYGDHESDLAFLKLCDAGHVVAPTGIAPLWAEGLHILHYQ
jgi:HAD superfamily hydrolase (TIGR01490 family)